MINVSLHKQATTQPPTLRTKRIHWSHNRVIRNYQRTYCYACIKFIF